MVYMPVSGGHITAIDGEAGEETGTISELLFLSSSSISLSFHDQEQILVVSNL
jgi:hypothetical protein